MYILWENLILLYFFISLFNISVFLSDLRKGNLASKGAKAAKDSMVNSKLL